MLIEISGIDGSGKSTLIAKLARIAHESGIPCYERQLRSVGRRVLTALAIQDGHTSWSTAFERGPVEFATALEMYQLFYSSVAPILFPGQIVMTDTYVRGFLATAAANGSADTVALVRIYGCLPAPDLSLQLDCPVDVAFNRILARPKGDHILRSGGRPRLQRLADAYNDDINELVHYPAVHLDSKQTVEALTEVAMEQILAWTESNDPLLYQRLAADE